MADFDLKPTKNLTENLEKMKLIEILTKANNLKCDCFGCLATTYSEMENLTVGLEKELITILAEENLSDILKSGHNKVNIHIKIRFSFLINMVENTNRRKVFLKNLILNPQFDLDLLDLSLLVRNTGIYSPFMKNGMRTIEAKRLGFDNVITNAHVLRSFPELFENKILTHDPEKVLIYANGIFELGYNRFHSYFKTYSKGELIVITHVLVDEYLKSQQGHLVEIIQKFYRLIEGKGIGKMADSNFNAFVELTNKILTKCNHACLPFETPNFGAESLDEYKYINNQTKLIMDRINSLYSENSQKLKKIESIIQENLQRINTIQKEIDELEKQKLQNLKSEIRLTRLNLIGSLHPLESLKEIIQSEHPIFYYPEFMFEDVFEYVDELTPNEKSKLFTKLSKVKKGVLKKLKVYLSEK